VQALGTGIKFDKPLAEGHDINAAVRDAAVAIAGYQGTPAPNQWFGGPEFATKSPLFGRTITVSQGSIMLRDTSGLVVDSLNYGGLVDPWAAEGYQATSGMEQNGCYVPAPESPGVFGPASAAHTTNSSAGRFPDGIDTGSNCNDFRTQAATTLPIGATADATNIKVASVAGFEPGRAIKIDTGAGQETAVIATVGTPGATTTRSAIDAGVTSLPVASPFGFSDGQNISIDHGANSETAEVASVNRYPTPSITVKAPLANAHAADVSVSGSGITLAAPLTRAHDSGAPVTDNLPTPGAPNQLRSSR
jgi:hypothetical protein